MRSSDLIGRVLAPMIFKLNFLKNQMAREPLRLTIPLARLNQKLYPTPSKSPAQLDNSSHDTFPDQPAQDPMTLKQSELENKKTRTIKACEACQVTSTPQWRRGPSGARTLCNACGVKYSQGRPLVLKQKSACKKDESMIKDDSLAVQDKIYYKNTLESNVIRRQASLNGQPLGSQEIMIHKPAELPALLEPVDSRKRKRQQLLPQPSHDELMAIDLEASDFDSDSEEALLSNFLAAVHAHQSRKEQDRERILY